MEKVKQFFIFFLPLRTSILIFTRIFNFWLLKVNQLDLEYKWSTILPILTNLTTTSHLKPLNTCTNKISGHITMNIQILTWDRQRCVGVKLVYLFKLIFCLNSYEIKKIIPLWKHFQYPIENL